MTACVPALVLVHGILQFNFDYDKNDDEKWNCFLLNRTHSVAWGWVTPIWCASPIDYTDTQCSCLSYGCFVISFLHLSSSIFFIDMSFFYFLIISRCSLFIVHLFNGARLKSFFFGKSSDWWNRFLSQNEIDISKWYWLNRLLIWLFGGYRICVD